MLAGVPPDSSYLPLMRMFVCRAALALALLPASAGAQSLDVPVRVMLFADATYAETERDAIADGFSLGQVVGHLNASLSPKLLVFVEGTLTPTAAAPVATLERLIVRYDFRDWLKLSGGRYHNPISYWNTAFHHGSWLQPSVSRPRIVGYGTPYLPIHFNGLLAEGALHTGPVIVAYEAGIGNGRQDALTAPGDAGDNNGSLALLGGLRLRSIAIPGAELGVHAYDDGFESSGGRIDERILSAHLAFQRDVELIAEFLRITHEHQVPGIEGSYGTNAYYVHAGYRLPSALFGLRPYVRYEQVDDPEDNDFVFAPALGYTALVGGIRWDFSDFAAIKAEYRDEEINAVGGAPDDGQSLLLNLSFVIPNLLGGGQSAAGH